MLFGTSIYRVHLYICMCVLVRSLFMVSRSRQWMLVCCQPCYQARTLSPGSWRHQTEAAQQESVWFCRTAALVRDLTLCHNANSRINWLLTGIENIQCVLSCADPVPGACNQEFALEIDPNIHLQYNLFETTVTFAPANIGYERWEKFNKVVNLSGHFKESWNQHKFYKSASKVSTDSHCSSPLHATKGTNILYIGFKF